MLKQVLMVLTAIAVGMVLPAASFGALLVDNGQNRTTIVLPVDALPATRTAADDLKHYLDRISGAEVPIVRDARQVATPVTIWVGDQPGLRERFADADLAFDEAEQFVILIRGNDVALVGQDEQVGRVVIQAGTSLAVYEFIERFLGVRWLWPGQLGEHVPQAATIDLPDTRYRYAPQLKQRGLRFINFQRSLRYPGADVAKLRPIMERMDQEAGHWYRRQRGGGSFRMQAGHAFTQWPERFGQSNPEYFALQADGSRDYFPSARTAKLCISNPDVQDQIITDAQQALQAAPWRNLISGSPNDSAFSGWCRCDNCRAWDARTGPTFTLRWKDHEEEHVALTDRYVRFWNVLAQRLREAQPDREVMIGAWAYGAMRTPPVEARLDDRIVIGFVGGLPADNQAARQRDRQYWDDWAKAASRMVWRPNLFHSRWSLPTLYARRTGEDMRFMAQRGLMGLDVDTIFHNWAGQGLQYYLLAKLAWDPYADVEALIQDYIVTGFGQSAARYVTDYFNALEQLEYELVERLADKHRYAMIDEFIALFTPQRIEQLQAYLQAAQQAASQDIHRQRLAFLQVGLEFTDAQMAVMRQMNALRLGQGDRRQIVQAAVDAVVQRDALLEQHVDTFALGYPQYHNSVHVRIMQAYLGPVNAADLELLHDQRIVALPTRWQFRLDPQNVGIDQQWFASNLDTRQWDHLLTTAVWGEQLPNDDPDDPEGRQYNGVAWYRSPLPHVDLKPGERLWLEFGAIDESAWVYVNGQQIGAQVYDAAHDPQAWRKPRRFDITNAIAQGPSVVAVRVQALVGNGGIYGGASLRRVFPNLVSNGQLSQGSDGLQGWSISTTPAANSDQPPTFTTQIGHGQYVGESSVQFKVQGNGLVSLGAMASHPLEPGLYEAIVRYRQTFDDPAAGDGRPLAMRWSLVPSEGPIAREDRHWAFSAPESSADWQQLQLTLQVPEQPSYRGMAVRIYLRQPGLFEIDEVSLRRVEP